MTPTKSQKIYILSKRVDRYTRLLKNTTRELRRVKYDLITCPRCYKEFPKKDKQTLGLNFICPECFYDQMNKFENYNKKMHKYYIISEDKYLLECRICGEKFGPKNIHLPPLHLKIKHNISPKL